jgi:hypothetical protein
MTAGIKNDRHARQCWGDLYDSLPKSVFATAAWHLANVASDTADAPGAAEKRFFEELRALVANNIIPKQQLGRMFKDFD